jgi:DNA-binding MarR family transcriptional regulator
MHVTQDNLVMTTETRLGPEQCNCLAVRQAARHITQFSDQCLAPSGLRTTQFSILAKLERLGSVTINFLATDLVMDRTTLGRNILPLQREGLIAVVKGRIDRRSKELRVTEVGAERLAPRSKDGSRRRPDSRRCSAPTVPQSCGRCCAPSRRAISASPTATISHPTPDPDWSVPR